METLSDKQFEHKELSLIYSGLQREVDYLIRNRDFSERRKRLILLRNKIHDLCLDFEEEEHKEQRRIDKLAGDKLT